MSENFTYNKPLFHRDESVVLEQLMQLNGLEALRYKKLDEGMRNKASKKVMTILFNRIESGWAEDPVIGKVMASQGMVGMIKEHDLFEASLDEYYHLTERNRNPAHKYATQLRTINDFLKTNNKVFNNAFRTNNRVIMFYYSTLVILMYQSLAYILSITVDFSVAGGTGGAILGQYEKPKNLTSSILLTNLATISDQIKNGHSQDFLNKANEEGNINEVAMFAFLLASIGIVLATLWMIRDLIEFVLIFRNRIGDWFESYAAFLEMRNLQLQSTNKTAAAKQKAIATRFKKIAKKIQLENDMANKEAIKMVKSQDKKIDLKDLEMGGFDSLEHHHLL